MSHLSKDKSKLVIWLKPSMLDPKLSALQPLFHSHNLHTDFFTSKHLLLCPSFGNSFPTFMYFENCSNAAISGSTHLEIFPPFFQLLLHFINWLITLPTSPAAAIERKPKDLLTRSITDKDSQMQSYYGLTKGRVRYRGKDLETHIPDKQLHNTERLKLGMKTIDPLSPLTFISLSPKTNIYLRNQIC